MSTPFDFVKSINNKTDQLEIDEQYVPFIVNRAFSTYNDTIFYSQILNMYPMLDKQMQYDFYYHIIPKKSRFAKWPKTEKDKYILIIQEYYDCSLQKAKEMVNILNEEQLKYIELKLDKGGRTRDG